MPPQEDAPPSDIVQGFLEALTSDDPHYETARKYLTGAAAKNWRPDESATVLAGGPGTSSTTRATERTPTTTR
ncbi:LpqB family beta-propeller domain-containing protein [Streptomyces violaceorubidus]